MQHHFMVSPLQAMLVEPLWKMRRFIGQARKQVERAQHRAFLFAQDNFISASENQQFAAVHANVFRQPHGLTVFRLEYLASGHMELLQ